MIRKFYRALSVALACAALLGTWLLYKGDFWSLKTASPRSIPSAMSSIRKNCLGDRSGKGLEKRKPFKEK